MTGPPDQSPSKARHAVSPNSSIRQFHSEDIADIDAHVALQASRFADLNLLLRVAQEDARIHAAYPKLEIHLYLEIAVQLLSHQDIARLIRIVMGMQDAIRNRPTRFEVGFSTAQVLAVENRRKKVFLF